MQSWPFVEKLKQLRGNASIGTIVGSISNEEVYECIDVVLNYIEILENSIRANRDAKGHNRCWFECGLYSKLPEHKDVDYELPSESEFLTECRAYYESCQKILKDT